MAWGVFDTLEHLWVGDNNGPVTFEDKVYARCAAMIADARLGQEIGRTVAKEYTPGPKRMRDEKHAIMDAVTALRKLETGEL